MTLPPLVASPQGLPNRQRLSELPHALLLANRLNDLTHFLCDLSVIECFFEAGRGYAEHLLVMYDEAITRLAAHSSGDMAGVESLLKSFFLFVSKWFHVLCLEPHLLPSLASNAPRSSPVSAAAAESLRSVSSTGQVADDRPSPAQGSFLQWLNRPQIADACVQTNLFAHRVNTGALSEDTQVGVVCVCKELIRPH